MGASHRAAVALATLALVASAVAQTAPPPPLENYFGTAQPPLPYYSASVLSINDLLQLYAPQAHRARYLAPRARA